MVLVMQQVLEALLKNTIAPAVARSGDLDDAVKTLKQSVVGFTATTSSAPKDVLAKHFGKSDRWVYRHLSEANRQNRRNRRGGASEGPKTLLERVSLLLVSEYPKALTTEQIVKNLRAQSQRIDEGELRSLLGLYANMGLLKAEAMGADGATVGFAATNRFMTSESSDIEERVNLVAQRSGAIFPIALSYVQGDPEAKFSYTQVRLMRKHLAAAVDDCRDFMVKRFNQAVEDSLKEDPEERQTAEVVDYALLFLGGVSRSDDQT